MTTRQHPSGATADKNQNAASTTSIPPTTNSKSNTSIPTTSSTSIPPISTTSMSSTSTVPSNNKAKAGGETEVVEAGPGMTFLNISGTRQVTGQSNSMLTSNLSHLEGVLVESITFNPELVQPLEQTTTLSASFFIRQDENVENGARGRDYL